jgi:transcriptional regulator with XRE-family HTH domain
MDLDLVARELLRALRKNRSQLGFSRRLGYATNVAYTWEAGRRSPTALELLRIAHVVGGDVRASLGRFFAAPPAWLAEVDPLSEAAVHRLLLEVCGGLPRADLARRTGYSRHAVGRWLAGTAMPRVPELLALVHHASNRLPDFVACFVDPAAVPSLADTWRQLEARRTLVARLPWAPAVLRFLEIAGQPYSPGWIAARLGIPLAEEERTLAEMREAGVVRWDVDRWAPAEALVVDTRRTPGRALASHWARVGLDRLDGNAPGLFGYNVLSVSTDDLEALRALHRAYYQQIRALAAASSPLGHVVVVNVQLFEL